MADRESYERTLTRFKDGDLDGARQGFAEFLVQHPHSDLAPNARFWLGESYYGKKDYSRAIDAYDCEQVGRLLHDVVNSYSKHAINDCLWVRCAGQLEGGASGGRVQPLYATSSLVGPDHAP